MQFTLLSSGKAFTDPLLLLVTAGVLTSTLNLAIVRAQRRARLLSALTTCIFLLIAVAAMPITPLVINFLLRPAPAPVPFAPEYIVVPSGGYERGADRSFAVMTSDTAIRTVGGIEWWRQAPSAKLVFTGGDNTPRGTMPTTVELMRDEALRRGVPTSAIIVEANSRNTREHGIRLATMLPRAARIGVITEGWHLPRTCRVFRRHFLHVYGRPADAASWDTITINHFVPSSPSMRLTAILLQEYVGMAWYALRS